MSTVPIYRYKFSEDFSNLLFEFSKIHEYDERKQFKESWKKWVEENEEYINREIELLKSKGCDDDIMDKMFKSARYYYRKKKTCPSEENKSRKQYIGNNKTFLSAIDNNINDNYEKNMKPSDSFNYFCNNYKDIIIEEIQYLISYNITDQSIIEQKIKKTYKNRYNVLVNKKKIEN